MSSFDTEPRWLPVTPSAGSRRSYGKIADCEQSTLIVTCVPGINGQGRGTDESWNFEKRKGPGAPLIKLPAYLSALKFLLMGPQYIIDE